MKTVILPSIPHYMDYINKILIDSFVEDIPTKDQTISTVKLAKQMVYQSSYFIVEETPYVAKV